MKDADFEKFTVRFWPIRKGLEGSVYNNTVMCVRKHTSASTQHRMIFLELSCEGFASQSITGGPDVEYDYYVT